MRGASQATGPQLLPSPKGHTLILRPLLGAAIEGQNITRGTFIPAEACAPAPQQRQATQGRVRGPARDPVHFHNGTTGTR